MSPVTTRPSGIPGAGGGLVLATCDECSDGIRGHASLAREWAENHHHESETMKQRPTSATEHSIGKRPPSVGRIVHYTARADSRVVTHAAIIVAVLPGSDGRVALYTFPGDYSTPPKPGETLVRGKVDFRDPVFDGELGSAAGIPYSPEAKAGHWSYPPRVSFVPA